jgi:hypothetical protein
MEVAPLFAACTNILNLMGEIEQTNPLTLEKHYENERIIVRGDLTKNQELTQIHIELRKPSEVLATPSADVPFRLPPRRIKDILTRERWSTTTVAILQRMGQTVVYHYYRPGRWTHYILGLAAEIVTNSEKFWELNGDPIDDDDLFPESH